MQKQMTDVDFEKLALEFDAIDAKLKEARSVVLELENKKGQLLKEHGITEIGSPIYKAWGDFNQRRRAGLPK